MLYLCVHYALPTGTWHHYMGLLLLFLVITLLVSFLCSTLESVLMTTTLSYISLREDEGDKAAVLFKKYKLDTERPLAAILSLNTIANTVGSVGIGMQATLVFGNKWVGLTSAIVTLLILIFAEIIPKTIGTTYWKSLMTFTAYTTRALIVIMFPFVLLVHYLTRMFHKEDTVGDNTVSREEVSAMANVGEEEGVIEKDENKILCYAEIKGVKDLEPRTVSPSQWQRMWLAEDKNDYKVNLAATLFADVLRERQRAEAEKQQEEKRMNSPEHKQKEEREEKAKEALTRAETGAVIGLVAGAVAKQEEEEHSRGFHR